MKHLYSGLVLAALLAASSSGAISFSSDSKATREYFRGYCDYVAAEKTNCEVIFIGGYYMRNLVSGYRIFGERRYLEAAISYADGLLDKQSERGYWLTGYGKSVYLADTSSAQVAQVFSVKCLIILNCELRRKFVTRERG